MAHSYQRYAISAYIGMLLQYAPLIAVPILCYQYDNWWLLFGILFVYAGVSVGFTKIKYLIFVLLTVAGIIFWSLNGFNFHELITFYLICFLYGFVGQTIYRIVGFGDKKSRAMIAASGNKLAREEIEKEVSEGMEKWRLEKANKENND